MCSLFCDVCPQTERTELGIAAHDIPISIERGR